MSYDLMVSDMKNKRNGVKNTITKRSAFPLPALQNWFTEMIEKFPPMNGEYAPNLDPLDEDEGDIIFPDDTMME